MDNQKGRSFKGRLSIRSNRRWSGYSLALFMTWLSLLSGMSLNSFAEAPPRNQQRSVQPKDKKLIRILTIDGGGIRGLMPALVLKELEARLKTKKNLAECFDIMAGTSTGGLIVLMLNVSDQEGKPKYKASFIADLYKQLGTSIFAQSPWHWIKTANGWLSEKYSAENLENFLERYLGETRLRDAITNIVIPTYDIERDKAVFFRTSRAKLDLNKDFFMKDIGRATSAAPTYFKPAKITNFTGENNFILIDGGVAANNPALAACVHAIEIYGRGHDFLIVSLGTGTHYGAEKKAPYSTAKIDKGGKLEWASDITSLLMYASSDTIHYQLMRLFNNNGTRKDYHRFQPILEEWHSDMDNTSPENIKALETYAQEMIQTRADELDELARILDAS